MRLRVLALLLSLAVCAPCLAAEQVVEVWRSPFGVPRSVSVNPADGSVWAAVGPTSVLHLAADGEILSQTDRFREPGAVAVNTADGSCWVADSGHSRVVHLAADGSILWCSAGYPLFSSPASVSVNPTDGSCWVVDGGGEAQVVHLAENGTVLWRGVGLTAPVSVSVNGADGSCWVADSSGHQVVHYAANGAELWRGTGFSSPQCVSVNPTDGSCWVADGSGAVTHLAAGGSQLWRGTGFSGAYSVSVNPTDGSCWVAVWNSNQIVHLSASGTELWRSADGFPTLLRPVTISVNAADGSCWTAYHGSSQILHYSAAGAELWRSRGFNLPNGVCVNPTDSSCWVADSQNWQIVHLAASGAELWRSSADPAFAGAFTVSVNASDGSCWVAGADSGAVIHLAADGSEMWRREGIQGLQCPISVSVNVSDGSCWVADAWSNEVIHLAANGAELWRGGGFDKPTWVSANPTDGSCWVGDNDNDQVVHLSSEGVELWRGGGFSAPFCVSVNPTDGSCWVANVGRWDDVSHVGAGVVHLAADGSELWRSEGFILPQAVSANSADGTCWVATMDNLVVHLAADGTELWRGGGFQTHRSVSANSADASCWVADTYNYQIVHLAPERSLFATFESSRSPFSSFAAGGGEVNTWRAPLTGEIEAHSGLYAMSSEVAGAGVTGLRLDLPREPNEPTEVTLHAWAYVADGTAQEVSAFFGFVFSAEGLSPTLDPGSAIGWEVQGPDSSRHQLAGTAIEDARGLAAGRWQLVQLEYNRLANTVKLWLNGELLSEQAAPLAAHRAPAYLVLGVSGQSEAAHTRMLFDDVQISLVGYAGPPQQDHPFALVAGAERVAQGQTKAYTITYGNGYPMLGTRGIAQTLPDSLHVGVTLPEGYTFDGADPGPTRIVDSSPVWDLPLPQVGQAGLIYLTATMPSGVAESEERLWTWATTEAAAGGLGPPDPPGDTLPIDAAWGLPQDALPQRVAGVARPDVWVRSTGPRFASPGDTIAYAITVGNDGETAAEGLLVHDLLPVELGGRDGIIGSLARLEPGDTWEGILSASLPWGTPGDTLLLNTTYVPTGPAESDWGNNVSVWQTTVLAVCDPNGISVSPGGGTDRGQQLTYTLQCENTGLGTAYGVYVTTRLDRNLDDTTLLFPEPAGIRYDSVSRVLVWEIGRLAAGEGVETSFTVAVADTARRARPINAQATVYFPSVPEETPTNIVTSVVAGSFTDVPWDHWALVSVELAYENGIVGGYGPGVYRPTLPVDRGQMAVFISRAMAGGDGNVPTGPVTASFTDVPTTHWAYKYVEYAKAAGVVGGYGGGLYRPTLPVDRGQMAVFVARAMAGGDSMVPPGPDTPTFTDVTPATAWAWAYNYVEYAASHGVVAGYANGTYRPTLAVTRDQMAVYVARAFALPM